MAPDQHRWQPKIPLPFFMDRGRRTPHNGGNFSDPSFINSPVWNGREEEACDTTGTETDGGYTEALFNFRVASYLRRDLIAEGAKVVMTRRTNNGVGPC